MSVVSKKFKVSNSGYMAEQSWTDLLDIDYINLEISLQCIWKTFPKTKYIFYA